MTISIEYDSRTQSAVLSPIDKEERKWSLVSSLLYENVSEIKRFGDAIYVPIDLFSAVRVPLANYAFGCNISISLSDEIASYLSDADKRSYSTALSTPTISPEIIEDKLYNQVGFKRKLTDNQLNNLSKIGAMPSAATFSVPGAGKTTEALAFFFLNATESDKLLVVAPKNAFGAWDEQLADCMGDPSLQFVRLRGGEDKIDRALKFQPRFSIITYQQYPRVARLLSAFLRKNRKGLFMYLDESHRVKSGRSGVSADAILSVATLPSRKLVMSGTPMPQSVNDLIPQFSFLYPDWNVSEDTVIKDFQPIYVRTNSSQLGIPAITHKRVALQMSQLQANLYASIKSETKRQLIPLLSDLSKASLRDIGKKIMKVMQFVSNPALLASDVEYIFDPKLAELLIRENGPKIEYACIRARELAAEGKKVIIWSQFVENVELIAERLKDLGADYIHGGVDAGDEDENDTREWKIKEFHNNPHKMVLVANPAAASEGISLHKVCQYAIYVDRSFNAAHYLQSEDRIHRLGLRNDQIPIVEIVECDNTIDQLIAQRLEIKVDAMSKALNDSALNICALDCDVDFESEEEQFSDTDIQAIRKYFDI